METLVIQRFHEKEAELLTPLQQEGWGDIRTHFRFFAEQPFCLPVVGKIFSEIVGMANNIKNGSTGWLSHIIVKNEFRRRGFGYKLTEYVTNDLIENNFKTVFLIATEWGEPVYRKLGFETVSYYNFYQGEAQNIATDKKNIKPIRPDDVKKIFELDRKMSGEEREQMLLLHLNYGSIYWIDDFQTAQGFYLPSLGEGLIVADNELAGIELLKVHLASKPAKVVVPEENKVAIDFLIKNGYNHFASSPKMILGKPVQANPEMQFSRVGGFYG